MEGNKDASNSQTEEVDDDVDENSEGTTLHFFDSIVLGDEKIDSSVALTFLEASFHMLKQRFPHIKKVILQSDNAKNFGGNVITQLLPLAAGAAGLECIAYYHNEAAAGKDVCDTHFSH